MIHEYLQNKNQMIIENIITEILPLIRGKANAMTAADIAYKLGVEDGSTSTQVRFAMKHLLCKDHLPIVSSTSGFFVALTKQEILDYRQNLERRAEGLLRDIDALDSLLQQF